MTKSWFPRMFQDDVLSNDLRLLFLLRSLLHAQYINATVAMQKMTASPVTMPGGRRSGSFVEAPGILLVMVPIELALVAVRLS